MVWIKASQEIVTSFIGVLNIIISHVFFFALCFFFTFIFNVWNSETMLSYICLNFPQILQTLNFPLSFSWLSSTVSTSSSRPLYLYPCLILIHCYHDSAAHFFFNLIFLLQKCFWQLDKSLIQPCPHISTLSSAVLLRNEQQRYFLFHFFTQLTLIGFLLQIVS